MELWLLFQPSISLKTLKPGWHKKIIRAEMIKGRSMHPALYYDSLKDDNIRCLLCPHYCLITEGQRGICRQRRNENGILYSDNYGRVVSVNLDPMEKKPLYHFHPGCRILSVGTNGCNLGCQFCQNWSISQRDSFFKDMSPEALVGLAQQHEVGFIAYTYNEPFIWYEYVLACVKTACKKGLLNVLVTNGYVNPDPLKEILPYIAAMNIDIKSMSVEFYKKLCGAKLAPVLETAKIVGSKLHLEVTNLIIPGENDSPEEIVDIARWVADNLGAGTPLHLSAYFPDYLMVNPPTSAEKMKAAFLIAGRYLRFVYLGNVMGLKEGADTFCYKCRNRLVARKGYQAHMLDLSSDGACKRCGADNNIKL
jgi:pyruvate formate lyase activating enzyme